MCIRDSYKPVSHKLIKVNDIVLLKEPMLKPSNYPMGIVSSVTKNSVGEITDAMVRKGSTRETVHRTLKLSFLYWNTVTTLLPIVHPLQLPVSSLVSHRVADVLLPWIVKQPSDGWWLMALYKCNNFICVGIMLLCIKFILCLHYAHLFKFSFLLIICVGFAPHLCIFVIFFVLCSLF